MLNISVEAAHVFHNKIPTEDSDVLAANGGGTYNFTQHMLAHVMLDFFIWESDLKGRNMVWVLSPTRHAPRKKVAAWSSARPTPSRSNSR